MKKILTILAIIFIASTAYGLENFYAAGSLSYDPLKVDNYSPEGMNFRTELLVGYQFKAFFAEAQQNTEMVKSELHMFQPYNAEYFVRSGFRFGSFYVQYEHLCIHGVDEYNPKGGHDRFTIGFDTRQKR